MIIHAIGKNTIILLRSANRRAVEIKGILRGLNKKGELNLKEAFKFFKQGLINSSKEFVRINGE